MCCPFRVVLICDFEITRFRGKFRSLDQLQGSERINLSGGPVLNERRLQWTSGKVDRWKTGAPVATGSFGEHGIAWREEARAGVHPPYNVCMYVAFLVGPQHGQKHMSNASPPTKEATRDCILLPRIRIDLNKHTLLFAPPSSFTEGQKSPISLFFCPSLLLFLNQIFISWAIFYALICDTDRVAFPATTYSRSLLSSTLPHILAISEPWNASSHSRPNILTDKSASITSSIDAHKHLTKVQWRQTLRR